MTCIAQGIWSGSYTIASGVPSTIQRTRLMTRGLMCHLPRGQPSVIPKQQFVNKLRDLGYSYNAQLKRVDLWRRGTHFISVRRSDLLSEEFCTSALRQAMCSDQEIREFIGSVKA